MWTTRTGNEETKEAERERKRTGEKKEGVEGGGEHDVYSVVNVLCCCSVFLMQWCAAVVCFSVRVVACVGSA
jgi:hypothetical protein